MNPFLEWMRISAIDEKEEAAKLADTAVQQMRLMAYEMEGKKHGRVASSDLAGKIERALAVLGKRKRHKPLPVVTRGDLNPTCAECEYFKKCHKGKS